jgi:hypothetical protein
MGTEVTGDSQQWPRITLSQPFTLDKILLDATVALVSTKQPADDTRVKNTF